MRRASADIREAQSPDVAEPVRGLPKASLRAHPGFCNGPWCVNPFSTYEVSFRRGRASVRGRRGGRHLMGFEEDGVGQSTLSVVCSHGPDGGLALSIVPASGPRSGVVMTRPKLVVRTLLVLSSIPLFDRGGHSFVPTCTLQSAARKRRQGWPLGHRRRRRAASLMVPSTALG